MARLTQRLTEFTPAQDVAMLVVLFNAPPQKLLALVAFLLVRGASDRVAIVARLIR